MGRSASGAAVGVEEYKLVNLTQNVCSTQDIVISFQVEVHFLTEKNFRISKIGGLYRDVPCQTRDRSDMNIALYKSLLH